MELLLEDFLKLLLALGLGGLIGIERELRDKAAGFRTQMFICAGSALFTMLSLKIAHANGAPGDRIAAQIVSGVGFLGAGVILREGGEIRGLTTAATIWLSAALGMGVGSGYYAVAVAAEVLILAALVFFPSLERTMNKNYQIRTYYLTFPANIEDLAAYEARFKQFDLKVTDRHPLRRGDQITCYWVASGRMHNHEALIEHFLLDRSTTSFEYQMGKARTPC